MGLSEFTGFNKPKVRKIVTKCENIKEFKEESSVHVNFLE